MLLPNAVPFKIVGRGRDVTCQMIVRGIKINLKGVRVRARKKKSRRDCWVGSGCKFSNHKEGDRNKSQGAGL